MKKPVIILISFFGIASTFSAQDSINLVKKKESTEKVYVSASDIKEIHLSEQQISDSRFPQGFPKMNYTGNIEQDKLDYQSRIAFWKKQNPIKAEELLKKGLIK